LNRLKVAGLHPLAVPKFDCSVIASNEQNATLPIGVVQNVKDAILLVVEDVEGAVFQGD
jgi:hypothetical protein